MPRLKTNKKQNSQTKTNKKERKEEKRDIAYEDNGRDVQSGNVATSPSEKFEILELHSALRRIDTLHGFKRAV